MSKDPILNRIAQPMVDHLGIDPQRPAERLADLFFLASVTWAAMNVAMNPSLTIWLASAIHILGGHFIRRVCIDTARAGPNLLLVNPQGIIHMILRIVMIYSLTMGILSLIAVMSSKSGAVLQVLMFKTMLDIAESVLALTSLYLGMCRKPPPRRRNESLLRSGA